MNAFTENKHSIYLNGCPFATPTIPRGVTLPETVDLLNKTFHFENLEKWFGGFYKRRSPEFFSVLEAKNDAGKVELVGALIEHEKPLPKVPNQYELYMKHYKFLKTFTIKNYDDLYRAFDIYATAIDEQLPHWMHKTVFYPRALSGTYGPPHSWYLLEHPEEVPKIKQFHIALLTDVSPRRAVKVKDLTLRKKVKGYVNEPTYQVNNIPAYPEIIDELLELPHGDFKKVVEMLHPNQVNGPDDFYTILNQVKNSGKGVLDRKSRKAECFRLATKIMASWNEASSEPLNRSTLNSFLNYLQHPYDHLNALNILLDYYSSQDHSLTLHKIRNTYEKFLSVQVFDNYTEREEILGALLEKETTDRIVALVTGTTRFTVAQWLKYIENYDEYKGYPVEWLKGVL